VGALIGLGLLIAYDVTHFIGSRATSYVFDDLGDGMRDPEYERAEQTWVNGKPLEAIEMMREYLQKNPREQFVAMRIAEIYEKDLHNLVAASMNTRKFSRSGSRPTAGLGRHPPMQHLLPHGQAGRNEGAVGADRQGIPKNGRGQEGAPQSRSA